jgi:hypothetical protein
MYNTCLVLSETHFLFHETELRKPPLTLNENAEKVLEPRVAIPTLTNHCAQDTKA